MILQKIVIRNFGPHTDTVINIPVEPLAIVGDNGSGKSFLIEAIAATLYGNWPSRGPISDGITQGFTGDAYLAVHFQLNGISYVAERKIRKTIKTVSQEAYLYCSGENLGRPIVGPKVQEFNQEIENLLGDEKVFLASSFSSQFSKGDIVDCKPTERKRILMEILDLHHYQEKSDGFGERSKHHAGEKESAEQHKKILFERDDLNVDYFPQISQTDEQLKTSQEKLGQLKAAHQKCCEDAEFCMQKLGEVKERLAAAQEKKTKLYPLMVEKHLKETQLERSQIAGLYDELTDYQSERNRRIDANQKIELKNQEISKTIEANNELRKDFMEGLKIWQKKCDEILFREKDSKGELHLLKQKRSYIEEEKKRHLEQCKTYTDILNEEDYDYPPCRTCPALGHIKKEVSPEKDYDGLIHYTDKKIAEISNRLETDFVLPEKPEEAIFFDPSFLIPHIILPDRSHEIQTLNNVPALQADVSRLQEEINGLGDVEQSCQALEISRDNIVTTLKGIDVERLSIQSLQEKNQKEFERLLSEQTLLQEKKLCQETARKEIIELDKEILKKKSNQEVYSILQDAYGKNGIQAEFIDHAIPSLQIISDDLLQIATEGKLSLEFSTIKELKNGELAESLEILCSDNKGTRDVACFSGGEQRILRTIIRLSLAIFKSRVSKSKVQTLILDEVFDSLDYDNARNLVRVLQRLKDTFPRIIFVSHKEDLLADFPNKILVSGGKVK